MADKNLLREVKAISSSKIKNVFAYSDYWELWELGEDKSALLLEEGSFEECLEALHFYIITELEYKIREEKNMTIREHPDWFPDELRKIHQLRVEEIKKECFQKGKCITPNWSLRSMRNRDQCKWIAKNGNPSPHYPGA